MNLLLTDLKFILQQITIAEQHTAAIQAWMADPLNIGATPAQIEAQSAQILLGLVGGNPLAALGLRTVDGSLNMLPPGTPGFASSGQSFPRLTTPVSQTGSLLGLNGFTTAAGTSVTNTNYQGVSNGSVGTPTPGQTGNNVADAFPRFASNVIADQTAANQVLVATNANHPGVADPAIYAHWSGNLQQMLADGLLVPHPTLSGVYVETLLDPATNQPVLTAGTAQARPFGQQLNGSGQLVDETGSVILNVPIQPLNIDQGALNGWFTLFGQGFDHGLDLIPKSNAGRVYIPLQPSDPLYSTAPGAVNYMVMPRASQGSPNLTTAWIDMNQAYGSDPAFQVFLREYTLVNNRPVATGRMLEGAQGGLPTWAEVKAQALSTLGIVLTDASVGNSPVIATNDYGDFLAGPNGLPMVVYGTQLREGNLGAPIGVTAADSPIPGVAASLTGHAFLLDTGASSLDVHYVAGDGRVNENSGLTSFHTIFHNLHDQRIVDYKQILTDAALAGDVASLNEWLTAPLPVNASQAQIAALLQPAADGQWNGNRLFQAARFVTEMQYQHIAIQEFSRTLQPTLNLFTGGNAVGDSNIPLEFAQATYRFGHSMLTEEVQRLAQAANLDGTATWQNQTTGLIEAFVNPLGFTRNGTVAPSTAAGDVIRGMTRQVANAIDPSVTGALRNNLVGLPLDLAALNIARGNDVALPSLNEARAQFFSQTGDLRLSPYKSWYDFAYRTDSGLKYSEAVVNYMAAYGTHPSITGASSIEAKRAAAIAIFSQQSQPVVDATGAVLLDATGQPVVAVVPGDAADFMNATGAWAGGALGGLNSVDYWIGGLGEKSVTTVDQLGSTFAYVFEKTIFNLQGNDRLYYLGRLGGNLLSQIEQSTLNVLASQTTGATHLPGLSFATADWTLEAIQGAQMTGLAADGRTPQALGQGDPVGANGFPLVNRSATPVPGIANTLRYNGGGHVVLGGSAQADLIQGGDGGDTLYGDAANDILITGNGADFAYGGDGDDVIVDSGSPLGVGDLLLGENGNDVIQLSTGISISFGGNGSDYMIGANGATGTEQSGDAGNDFIQAAGGGGLVAGGVGDDWLEDRNLAAGDLISGEAGAGVPLDPTTGLPVPGATETGHDVILLRGGTNTANGDAGDDILVDSDNPDLLSGSAGFDWVDNSRHASGVNFDLALLPAFAALNAAVPQMDATDGLVEAVGGSRFNDQLFGDDRANIGIVPGVPLPGQVGPVPPANAIDNSLINPANNGGVELIKGLWSNYSTVVNGVTKTFSSLLGQLAAPGGALEAQTAADLAAGLPSGPLDAAGNFQGGNILLGGAGADLIYGRGGTDIIDGDASVQVQIVYTPAAGGAVQRFDSMDALNQAMLNRVINPAELSIERSLVRTETNNLGSTGDTAVYRGFATDYAIEGMVWDPNAVNRVDGRLGSFVLQAQASNVAATPVFQPQTVADGFLQVTHDPNANAADVVNPVLGAEAAAVNDGTDYLRNIEFLRFENGSADSTQWTVIDLRPTAAQLPAAPAIGSLNVGENPSLAALPAPLPTDVTGFVAAPDNAAIAFFAQQQVGGTSNVNANTDPTVVPEVVASTAPQIANPIATELLVQALPPAQVALNNAHNALLIPVPTIPGGGTTPGGGGSAAGGGGGGSTGGGTGSPSPALVQAPAAPVAPAPVTPVAEPAIQLASFNIEEAGQVGSFRDGSGYGAQWLDASKEAVRFALGGKLKGYRVIGAEEQGSGYEAMLQKGGKYAIARFGESGELISSKSVKKTSLMRHERRFEQDFNGDDLVGRGAALKSPAELQAGDVLIGEAGRQLYALANQRGDLYASSGDADALVIQDFRTGPDGDVLIASAGSEYSLGMVGDSAAIYKGSDPSQRDLVAVLEGVKPTAGMHVNFSFV